MLGVASSVFDHTVGSIKFRSENGNWTASLWFVFICSKNFHFFTFTYYDINASPVRRIRYLLWHFFQWVLKVHGNINLLVLNVLAEQNLICKLPFGINYYHICVDLTKEFTTILIMCTKRVARRPLFINHPTGEHALFSLLESDRNKMPKKIGVNLHHFWSKCFLCSFLSSSAQDFTRSSRDT